MVLGTARPGPLHLAHNRGWAQPGPQVPSPSLGTLPMWGQGELLGSVARGKCEVLCRQEGLPFPGSRDQGTWEPGQVTQGWGMLPGGRLVEKGPGWAFEIQSLGPKLASPGSDKSHLLGASPLFFHP